nr:MAG TPA_asm: hypothetical protein [Caudoviricetes sp.]
MFFTGLLILALIPPIIVVIPIRFLKSFSLKKYCNLNI